LSTASACSARTSRPSPAPTCDEQNVMCDMQPVMCGGDMCSTFSEYNAAFGFRGGPWRR
jgi:hypothetical protein